MEREPKSPAFQVYVKDILVDTALLSTEQFGAYVLLLFAAWAKVPGFEQCHLPEGDAALARLARMPEKKWVRIGAPVRALLQSDGKGALFSKRLVEELAKQRARRVKAKDSADRRWHGGEPPVDSAENGMRSHQRSDALKQAADADADGVGESFERKRGSGGETDGDWSAPYLRALEVLWPGGRRVRSIDVDKATAALAALRMGGRLDAPEDFAAGLWAWSVSEDWKEQDGRFVPLAEVFVSDQRWKRRPRRCPIAESDASGLLRRRAAANAIAEPELEAAS